MVVNKCCVHFWAACQLLQVGVMERPEAMYVHTECVVGLCKVGVLYLSSIKCLTCTSQMEIVCPMFRFPATQHLSYYERMARVAFARNMDT